MKHFELKGQIRQVGNKAVIKAAARVSFPATSMARVWTMSSSPLTIAIFRVS